MTDVVQRAKQSLGSSSDAIYQMVRRIVQDCSGKLTGTVHLIDVGCGQGKLYPYVSDSITSYCGVDVLRYDGFPDDQTFVEVDLDTGRVRLPDHSAEIVVAVETIEHLENPRAFMRELFRPVQARRLGHCYNAESIKLTQQTDARCQESIQRIHRQQLPCSYYGIARD